MGIDSNRNGVLDPSEVATSEYVCNGAPGAAGFDSLVLTATESPGTNCPFGGIRLTSGLDANRSGTLDPSEVTTTRYVCNANSGASSLLKISNEPAGGACPNGGVAVQAGLDVNGNGALDPSEVTTTQYVCNGSPPPDAFPVLSGIVANVCGFPSSGSQDTGSVSWTTASPTDTGYSITSPTPLQGWTDPTPTTSHRFDIQLAASTTYSVLLMSRDAYGLLGTATLDVAVPPVPPRGCVCVASSGSSDAGTFCRDHGCPEAGFNLEAGAPAQPAAADVYLTFTEDAGGAIQVAAINAPQGVVALANTDVCSVSVAPAVGYTTTLSVFASPGGSVYFGQPTTFVVKTSSGRYAKLKVSAGPSEWTSAANGITGIGLSFDYFVAPLGSTALAY
jgi:hypothetical protein